MGIKIMRDEKLWLEDEAVSQLKKVAEFEGVIDAVGLPDLHPGKTPVGATICTENIIYPFLIGNDIGCGMSLFNTNIKLKKFNKDKVVKKLDGTKIYGEYSIGGGNHFAELQSIDKIFDKELASKLSLDKQKLYLLVHSGSRQLGESIYRKYADINGFKEDSEEFNEYLKEHSKAIQYAKDNRINVADILMDMIGIKYDNEVVIDCIHNYLEVIDGKYYHHKGSISSLDSDFAIIAGSRGSYSYIVKCISQEEWLYSISHGAGRKWARHLCKGRLEGKYKRQELTKSKLGGTVILDNKTLLYEEASEAYKNIESVIDTLLDNKCIKIIARFKPEVTYKC